MQNCNGAWKGSDQPYTFRDSQFCEFMNVTVSSVSGISIKGGLQPTSWNKSQVAHAEPVSSQHQLTAYRGAEIPQGDFSVGKIPYFRLVRNFPRHFFGVGLFFYFFFPVSEYSPCG